MSQNPLITIAILDPNNGYPLHQWSFQDLERVRIGRTDNNEVAINSPQVSRLHAELSRENSDWRLHARGINGTIVDGQKVDNVVLQNGNVIQLGQNGPQLEVRFDAPHGSAAGMATVYLDSPDLKEFTFDTTSAASEADQIADSAELEAIREKARQIRQNRKAE